MPVSFGSTVNPDLVAIPKSSPTISNGQIDQFEWINFILKLATVTPNYREGSFVLKLTGVTGTYTQTYNYIQIGNYIFVSPSGNLLGPSNSTACTLTGLPAAITPRSIENFSVLVESSGTPEGGFVSVGTNGTITLGRANGSTTFVNDGLTKGLGSNSFAYSLSS